MKRRVVEKTGLEDERAIRNLEDSGHSEQDADGKTNQDEHERSWDKDMAKNRAAGAVVESGAVLYDEDEDLMAILQTQNEVLAQKRRQVLLCYMGDFNEVVQLEERKCASVLTATAKDFRTWIHDIELVNIELNDQYLVGKE
ncbi:hypothetical protein AHAS_Ahas18G0150000 [Arachis hypogaea]